MSPNDIILEKVNFTNKEEFALLKQQASNIYDGFPFLMASYIYKNSKEKEPKEIKSSKNEKSGLNIFSILANSEIDNISASKEDLSDEEIDNISFLRELVDSDWNFLEAEAAEKKKSVKLNKPFRTPSGPKKFGVYVKNEKGNVVLVRFGDSNMEIKRDDPERRKNFRARHGCDNPGPKWKAKYWSCKFWSSKNVSDLTASESEFDWENLMDEDGFNKSFE
jgi:hypothetical protein